MGSRAVESANDRKALVADAGFSRLSLISAAAGVLTAYGAFAVLAAVAAGILSAADVDVDVAADWRDLGLGGGLLVAALLLVAYLFGGYVAGRMARRAGALHGAVVFVLSLAVTAVAALIARELGGADAAADNLRDLGIPTTASEWGAVASLAGIASVAAMLLGAVGGAILGERWHSKLLTRALDPSFGAEAEAREAAARSAAEAEEHRTDSIQRVRTAAPTGAARVDAERGDPPVDLDRDQDPLRERALVKHSGRGSETDGGRDRHAGNGNSNGEHTPDDDQAGGRFWWRLHQPAEANGRTKDQS